MNTDYCLIGFDICIPAEAWAAWAQAILTVLTVWFSVEFQRRVNKHQLLIQQHEKNERNLAESKAQHYRAIYAAIGMKTALLAYHSNLRAALEVTGTPLARWQAIRKALASGEDVDTRQDIVMSGEMAPVLLTFANIIQTARHSPLGRRHAETNAEAERVLEDSIHLIRELLENLADTTKAADDLIDAALASDREIRRVGAHSETPTT